VVAKGKKKTDTRIEFFYGDVDPSGRYHTTSLLGVTTQKTATN